jgi:hypothetical protein
MEDQELTENERTDMAVQTEQKQTIYGGSFGLVEGQSRESWELGHLIFTSSV